MRGSADSAADMARRKHQIASVQAAGQVEQRHTRAGRHHIIIGRNNVKQRTGDLFQVDRATANSEFRGHQTISAKDLLDHFPEDAARQRYVAIHPSLEPREHVHVAHAQFVLVKIQVLGKRVMYRRHRSEPAVD